MLHKIKEAAVAVPVIAAITVLMVARRRNIRRNRAWAGFEG